MKKRIISFSIIAAMLLSPIAAFADTDADSTSESTKVPGSTASGYTTVGDSEDFKTITQGDLTYHDIYNGKTEDRKEVDNLDALVKQALYKVPEGGKYSIAEYWAAIATGIFAANPESYWSVNSRPFELRFMKDAAPNNYVLSSSGSIIPSYGNLQYALSAQKKEKHTTNSNDKLTRLADVNTIYSGMRKANSLADVQTAACNLLAEVNPGRAQAKDFMKYNKLKAMSEDTTKDTVYYHLMATRDKMNNAFDYKYTCFGIAYSDFTIIPFTGDDGQGATTALEGYSSLGPALAQVEKGKVIPGFSSEVEESEKKSHVINDSMEAAEHEVAYSWALDTTMSSTLSNSKALSFKQGESFEFSAEQKAGWTFEAGISLDRKSVV